MTSVDRTRPFIVISADGGGMRFYPGEKGSSMANNDRINPTEYPDGPQPEDLEQNEAEQGQDEQPQPAEEQDVERNEGQDITEDGEPVKKGKGKGR